MSNRIPMTADTPAAVLRHRGWRVLGFESMKILPSRAALWSLAVALTVDIGVAALAAWSVNLASDPQTAAREGGLTGAGVLTAGATLAWLVFGIFGALAITREYSSGQIRSTFLAVPRRLPVLAAKLVILLLTAGAVAAVAMLIAWQLTTGILVPYDLQLEADAAGVRILAGGAVAGGLFAALGLATGAIVRSSAGAITAMVALLLVVPNVIGLVPGETVADLARFLPSRAAAQLLAERAPGGALSPAAGLLVVLAWCVVALIAAAVLLKRRDP